MPGLLCLIRLARQTDGMVCWNESVNPTMRYCDQSNCAVISSRNGPTCSAVALYAANSSLDISGSAFRRTSR